MNRTFGIPSLQRIVCRYRGTDVCHFFKALLVTVLLLSARSVEARSWVPVGAPGGNVRALSQDPRDPQRIYLGTADGILYRSDDAGLKWRRMNPGFPKRGCSLDEIVVDARGVVLVGYYEVQGQGGGVARSTDGGKKFVMLKDIEGESVRALALSPSDPDLIAAGTLTGVFLSRDKGKSWSRITPSGHPDLRNVESLTFDPNDSQVLYAGTWHLVWKTVDGGGAWAPSHTGMIDDSDVMTLTVDSRDPKTLYATACSGIYRSTEGAAEWTKIQGIPFSSRRTRAFAQDREDVDLLLAGTTEGLWLSEDRGGKWRRMTSKELVVNSVIAQPGGTILLGTEGAGVLRSSDRGRTWAASNTGFSERFVFRTLFDPAGRRVIIASWGNRHYGGVFVSQGGKPWIRLGNGLDGRQVMSLGLMGETILAGTDNGIFTRAPEETLWTRADTRIGGRDANPRVTDLLVLPSNRLVAATANGVIRSADGGRTWTRPTLGKGDEVAGLAMSPDNPELIVAATRSGFFRSEDGGKTWNQASSALKVSPHALAFLPSDDRVLFATTSGGLYRSRDQGASWRRVNGGVPHSDLTGLAVHPDGHTIYVSDFTWGGIFRSVDGGSTWSRMPTDGLGSDRVWNLTVDPSAPERVLASSSAGGLHMLVTTPASRRTGASVSNAQNVGNKQTETFAPR